MPFISLTEIFTNTYTAISGDKLQIRSLNMEDIERVINKKVNGWILLNDKKYSKLFQVNARYWLPKQVAQYGLWSINANGESRSDMYAAYEYRS